MNAFEVRTSTSYGAREAAKAIIDGFGGPDCVKAVRLNTGVGVPDEKIESSKWPCVFECSSQKEGLYAFEIRVLMLTSGYCGTGPHDLDDLLRYAGFNLGKRVFQRLFTEEHFTK